MRDTSHRRERILSMMREQGSVQVAALARQFAVSSQTIRQDLKFLVRMGMAARSYGGAMLHGAQPQVTEAALEQKQRLFYAEKVAIGRAAAALIRPGNTVILDSGTTTLQIATHIPADIEATVVTNDLAIANELSGHESLQLLMLGGMLRRKNMSLYGTEAERAMRDLSVDLLFLGVDGFDMERGITTHFEPEAILNRMMCNAAAEIVVVTDSSKFGRVCLHRILEPARIGRLITDRRAAPDMLEGLARAGVQVTQVSA